MCFFYRSKIHQFPNKAWPCLEGFGFFGGPETVVDLPFMGGGQCPEWYSSGSKKFREFAG